MQLVSTLLIRPHKVAIFKGGTQKEVGKRSSVTFLHFWSLLVTFSGASVTFCRHLFARTLLPDSFCGRVNFRGTFPKSIFQPFSSPFRAGGPKCGTLILAGLWTESECTTIAHCHSLAILHRRLGCRKGFRSGNQLEEGKGPHLPELQQ